jgi:hypothetical protein
MRDDYYDELVEELEQDAIASLHDTEAEAGDDGELGDVFAMDLREARALGVQLDPIASEEPRLD